MRWICRVWVFLTGLPMPSGSFRAQAERLLRFMDGVGIACCDLLGTSHGGAVAMMAAALARSGCEA